MTTSIARIGSQAKTINKQALGSYVLLSALILGNLLVSLFFLALCWVL